MANNFWSNMGLIALSGLTSYLSSKITSNSASWVPARNEMVANAANVLVSTALQQLQQTTAQQQAAATTEQQQTTAQ